MLNELLCLLTGHKYRVAQELTDHSRRLGCTRCGKAFAMSDDVQCVNHWDAAYHRMYESHGIKIEYKPWEFGGHNAKDQPGRTG